MSSAKLYNAVLDLKERMERVEELLDTYMCVQEVDEPSLIDQLKGSYANKINKRQKKTNRG